jgi:hypothetical protein
MKKLFTILGIIFATIIVIIIIAAAIFIPRTLKLDHEATVYIQNAVPKIVTNWNSQELVDRATSELLDAKSRDKIDSAFVIFKRLGSLKHLDTAQGLVTTGTYTGTGVATIGNYNAQAEFENGEATIEIHLRRVDDTWKISGFYIKSDALRSPKA